MSDEEKKKQVREFRLNSRKIFLTYPMKDGLEKKEQIVEHFKNHPSFEFALVSYEQSDDEHPYKHFHAVIGFKEKAQFVSCKRLDILGVHGQYEGVRNMSNAVDYVTKMGDFISEGYIDVEKILMERSKDMVGKLLIARMIGKRNIRDLVYEAQEAVAEKRYSKFQKDLVEAASKSKGVKRLLELEAALTEEKEETNDFYMVSKVYNSILDWLKDSKDSAPKSTLFIKGASGVGKTSAIEHMGYPGVLRIDHKDKAKGYLPNRHLILLFDDVNFKHLNREFKIKLLDAGRQYQMDVKGSCVLFDRRVARIILSNLPPEEVLNLGDSDKDQALCRRLKYIDLSEEEFKPFITLQEFEQLDEKSKQHYSFVNKGIMLATIKALRRAYKQQEDSKQSSSS